MIASGNSCFGIEATDDHWQYCLTKEYLNGEWTSHRLALAAYPTLNACFAAHARLACTRPAWQYYQRDHDLDALIRGVTEHHATNPNYATRILRLARGPHVAAAIVEARQRAANQVIVVDQFVVQMKLGGTQFTGGGAVPFQYHGTAAGMFPDLHDGRSPARPRARTWCRRPRASSSRCRYRH